jgi:hypothetical protein
MPEFSVDVWTAIGFSVLILVIGLAATVKNVQSTRGPKERGFVVRSNLTAWVVVACFFVAWYFAPHPYSYVLLVVYFAGFPFVVYRFCNRRLLIRRLEEIQSTASENT